MNLMIMSKKRIKKVLILAKPYFFNKIRKQPFNYRFVLIHKRKENEKK